MPPCAFDKQTAPGVIQTKPLQSRITGRKIRNLQQSMSARTHGLRSIPFQERLRRSADANRLAEQPKAYRATLLLIRNDPAQGQDNSSLDSQSQESPDRPHQDLNDKSTEHNRLHQRDLQN